MIIFSKSIRLEFMRFGIFFQKVFVCDLFVLHIFSKMYSVWVIRFFKRIKSKLFVFRKTYTFRKNG